MALLFQPLSIGALELENRMIIAPMCQYSATLAGEPTFWHEQQWASYALSGAGLALIEATAVQPEGRISYADLGLWNDQQAQKMKDILDKIRTISPMPFGVQLAHAGRKASGMRAWEQQGQQLPVDHELGWQTVAPSAIAFQESHSLPHALSRQEIQNIIQDFTSAAQRAVASGFDVIEIHAAHGYLLHQFMSPLSNQREDEYGGSFDNRIRLTVEVVNAIRAVVPENYPVGIRISATDWMPEPSWNVVESVKLSKILEQQGVAYIHVSSAGLHVDQKIEIQAGYQLEFAEAVKQAVKQTPVIAVGLITEPLQAEGVLQYGQADAVAIGRAILYNPRWPWHAAADLGQKIRISPQYLRCQPFGMKSLFQAY